MKLYQVDRAHSYDKVICSDLFTHKTQKGCDELVIQCLFVLQDCIIICSLICFLGGRKPEIPEKNPWSKDNDNDKEVFQCR